MARHTTLNQRIAEIDVLLLDVDGVLTDGSIYYSDSGEESKRFHVRDGSGIKLWHQAGHRIAILSGRNSPAVTRRARELGIEWIEQGRNNKAEALQTLVADMGVSVERLCAIGDDLGDLAVLKTCGVAIAVADACPEARALADFTTTTPGGHGAVREAIEWLLKHQHRWDTLVNQNTAH